MVDNFLMVNYRDVSKKIIQFITGQVSQRKKNGVVIGISGGVDSSVAAVLASRALKNKIIIGLIMPEKGVTPKTDSQNALSLAKKLEIRYKQIPIEQGKKSLLRKLPRKKLPAGNFSARLRMALLYYSAAIDNLLVLGTADKSELMLGYFTKFGDSGSDILPIAGLYKTQVRLLAKQLRVPEKIIQQPSSPRFWRGQLAEKEIGIRYDEIDIILESHLHNDLNNCSVDKKKIKIVTEMMKESSHKKEDTPICNPF